MRRKLTIVLAVLASAGAALVAEAQPGTSGAPEHRTFAIFLFPDYAWLDGERLETVQALHGQFDTFARAVSKRNTAIWLPAEGLAAAGAPSIEKSMTYCQRFGLDVLAGPYIVFTQIHPDYWKPRVHEKYYITLRGLDRAGVLTILTRLTEEMRSSNPNLRSLLLIELRERLRTTLTGMGLIERLISETPGAEPVIVASR